MNRIAAAIAATALLLSASPAQAVEYNADASLDTTQVLSAEDNTLSHMIAADDALYNISVAYREGDFILWYDQSLDN